MSRTAKATARSDKRCGICRRCRTYYLVKKDGGFVLVLLCDECDYQALAYLLTGSMA